jgi:hypothetical protein
LFLMKQIDLGIPIRFLAWSYSINFSFMFIHEKNWKELC